MNYAVVGAILVCCSSPRLVTLYGDEKPLPPVKLGAGGLSAGTLAYGAFKPHPLGRTGWRRGWRTRPGRS